MNNMLPLVALWVAVISVVLAVLHFALLGYDGAVLFLTGYGVSLLFYLRVDAVCGRQEGVIAEEAAKVPLRAQFFWNGGDLTLTAGMRALILFLPLCCVIAMDFQNHVDAHLGADGSAPSASAYEVWLQHLVLAHLVFVLPCICLRVHKCWMQTEIRWIRNVHVAAVVAVCMLLLVLLWLSRGTDAGDDTLVFFILYAVAMLWIVWKARLGKGVSGVV